MVTKTAADHKILSKTNSRGKLNAVDMRLPAKTNLSGKAATEHKKSSKTNLSVNRSAVEARQPVKTNSNLNSNRSAVQATATVKTNFSGIKAATKHKKSS